MPLTIPPQIKTLLAQPVAVFGGGVSGQAVLNLLARLGAHGVIFDEKQPGARTIFTAEDARAHRLVVFSPGFRPEHPWFWYTRAAECVCLGEVDFASLFWRGKVVAITGTNGKTTLTEFITHALIYIGRDARATGNIGHPFTQLVLETDGGVFDDIAVVEVSSFQAESFRHFRADSALWTNFAEDHLERHPGMAAYFEAKWHLLDRTVGGDFFVGSSVQTHAEKFGHGLPPEACVATENQPADVLLRGTVFEHYPQRENFILAAAWWQRAGLPEGDLYTSAHSFRLGRHRLAQIAEHRGVTYWNDSKATNFHATEAALSGFVEPVHLIAGGKAKGGDISAFAARIAPKIRHAYLIGETQPTLAAAFATLGVAHTVCKDLEPAVRLAVKNATVGAHVLLSPGFASLDQFRSYQDRGEQFENLVHSFAASSPS